MIRKVSRRLGYLFLYVIEMSVIQMMIDQTIVSYLLIDSVSKCYEAAQKLNLTANANGTYGKLTIKFSESTNATLLYETQADLMFTFVCLFNNRMGLVCRLNLRELITKPFSQITSLDLRKYIQPILTHAKQIALNSSTMALGHPVECDFSFNKLHHNCNINK